MRKMAHGHNTDISESSGQPRFVWKTFLNKHVDPVCSNFEFKENHGVKDSLEECMDAVMASKSGNIGIWQRGLDQNCYACDLLSRGKATSLIFKDSEHIDAFAQFMGEQFLYYNHGAEYMRTPGEW